MSVFKRAGSPFYYSEIVYRGIRSVRSTKTSSRREAEAFDREHKKQIVAKAGKPKRPSLTVDEACGRYWLEKGQHLGWSGHVERHLKWIVASCGSTPVGSFSNQDAGTVVSYRESTGAGAAGVNRTLSVLRSVLSRAQKVWGVEIQHIYWKEHFKKEPKGRTRHVTAKEGKVLWASLPQHIALAFKWSLHTGCRKEETFSIEPRDVDLDRGQVAIRKAKTGARIVWLTAESRGIITEALALCQKEKRVKVFNKKNVRRHWKKALEAAKIEDFHWHDTRHTHATWLRQAGAPLEVVARSLGHASIQTTMRYAHVDDTEVKDALAKLPTFVPEADNVVPIKKRDK